MIGFRMGRVKARSYGFDHRDNDPLTLYTAVGADSNPFKVHPDNFSTEINLMGKLTFQLVRDTVLQSVKADDGTVTYVQYKKVKTDSSGAGTAVEKNPAYLLEWLGSFGPIQPLIQYGTYDLGHSSLYAVGVKFKTDKMSVAADYVNHKQGYKGTYNDAAKKSPAMHDVHTRYNLTGEFKAGMVSPWLHYSKYDKEQDTNGGKQPKVNSSTSKFDDNLSAISVGSTLNTWGEAFSPFLSLERQSGKFLDKNKNDSDMSRLITTVGMRGQF